MVDLNYAINPFEPWKIFNLKSYSFNNTIYDFEDLSINIENQPSYIIYDNTFWYDE